MRVAAYASPLTAYPMIPTRAMTMTTATTIVVRSRRDSPEGATELGGGEAGGGGMTNLPKIP
jgi:hypothetical protein